MSDLYLFGRPQDIALQKARDNIHQRNHLRLWLSPMRYHGKQVWVGQISRDIGSRLTIHSPTLTTHKIDPDVDEARAALVRGHGLFAESCEDRGREGRRGAPQGAPRENLTTDPTTPTDFVSCWCSTASRRRWRRSSAAAGGAVMSRVAARVLRAFVTCLSLTLAGCATWQAPADVSDAPLRAAP